MDIAEKNTFLKDEYLQIEQLIVSFDQRAITIKAWSITASMAGLSAGFISGSHMLILLAGLSSLIFWVIEGLWKQFQSAHYKRCREIEKYFDGEFDSLIPLQIASSYIKECKKFSLKNLWRVMRWPHIALPHIAIAGAGIIIFILVLNGTINL